MRKLEVEKYYNKNLKKKEIDNELKDLRTQIIHQMKGKDQVDINNGEYTVNYKPSYSYTVDYDKVVENLVKYKDTCDSDVSKKIEECLEVKIVVNEEKLESLIYNGYIPDNILSECSTEKQTFRFTIKKGKKK